MRTNVPTVLDPVFTHEGAKASHITKIQQLRRLTLSALLFENTFYEKGSDQAKTIQTLVPACDAGQVLQLAVECREKMYLRHMPLFLLRELARVKGNGALVATGLERCIQRPDELAEYLAIYWKEGKQPLSAGSKRGLARAFQKFDAETLAKYDQDNAVKLRDVMLLVHAKPENWRDPSTVKSFEWRADKSGLVQKHVVHRQESGQAAVWSQLIARTLPAPDTWEVALSAGKDKKETFERLIREKHLGGLAFLRNLRKMQEVKVDPVLVRERFIGGFGKVLPFRFVAALRYAPSYVRELDAAMQRCLEGMPKLPGTTAILIDVSGSMDVALSAKSEMLRVDVAAGLGVLVSAVAEHARVFTFSDYIKEVPAHANLGLVEVIRNSQHHSGTNLGHAVANIPSDVDRLIVITDEQSHDRVGPPPVKRGYMINVAANKNGVGYGPWTHVDGWSERVIDFIHAYESDGQ